MGFDQHVYCTVMKNGKALGISVLKIGIVSCDAGGANQLLAYLATLSGCRFIGYFSGAASNLYSSYLKEIEIANDISDVVAQCDVLYTGTSWSSAVEHHARVLASEIGRVSVAALDHWINFPDRFTYNSVTQLPDRIITFDEKAFHKAKICFPSLEVINCESHYLEAVSKSARVAICSPGSYLYICEPFRVAGNNKYDLQQLERFFLMVKGLGDVTNSLITIRPHPSEPIEKYQEVIAKFNRLNVVVDTGDLGAAIGAAEFVVGYASYALYVASQLGKKVLIRDHPADLHQKFCIQEVLPVGTYEILP